ncbi:MAG: amino acid ABC transporter permease [Hydrogenophaga sp.]|uniref:amino acid ABC transporter permease n=1 Tax=Hydrogenophaga sp. TaxID=1904254 RepID=UPI001D25184A|nr:ABC transporter permease subunit [Hydrogenophaga sp.]MBW0172734.1 ABC transporter permease subunit [Hydrogenophaga sp.]MBW0184972.1 ABC transporter permease subunit [Hydrogenophaga sp.]
MMNDFAIVWSERGLLLSGLGNTVILSLLCALAALALGALLSMPLMSASRWLSTPARVFVDAARCTPFLLFAYLVYYGLPTLGLQLDAWSAGLLALTVYHAAYMAEILRAAWVAQPRAPIEAGMAFGYSGFGLFRRIVLPPLALSCAPVLGNQVIQIIKDSAFLTIITLPELTNAVNSIQSRHFIPFAAFVTAVLLYWVLCLVVEAAVSAAGRLAEARR